MNLKRQAINLRHVVRLLIFDENEAANYLSLCASCFGIRTFSSVVRSSIRALRCLINAPATHARVDREIANHSINAFPCNTHGNRIRNVRQTNERDFTEVLETPRISIFHPLIRNGINTYTYIHIHMFHIHIYLQYNRK